MQLTQQDLQHYKNEIEKKRQELSNYLLESKAMIDNESGYEEKLIVISSRNAKLAEMKNEIRSLENIIAGASILKEQDLGDDIVNIGDYVDILFKENNTVRTVKLVTTFIEMGDVSIESPLGASIYKKQVGSDCSYVVKDRRFGGKHFEVTILAKKSSLEQDTSTALERE